jgi:hypothetical protein
MLAGIGISAPSGKTIDRALELTGHAGDKEAVIKLTAYWPRSGERFERTPDVHYRQHGLLSVPGSATAFLV